MALDYPGVLYPYLFNTGYTTTQPLTVTTTANTYSGADTFYAHALDSVMRNYQAQTTYSPPRVNDVVWLGDGLGTVGAGTTPWRAPWTFGFRTTPQVTAELKAEYQRQARLDDLATARAKALLLEHLDEQQRAEYKEKRYFHVIGQSGKLYRIKHGIAGNIYQIGLDGNEEHSFCVHFTDRLPAEDHMLGQLLRLRYDEEKLLALANKRW